MIERTAIRAVLLCEETEEVLLMRVQLPHNGEIIWVTPGGGLEAEESELDCLRREVFEETGHRAASGAGPIWIRHVQFPFQGNHYDQTELYYLVHTQRFEPTSRHNPAQEELDTFLGFRWWSLSDLPCSTETIVPRLLHQHLQQLLHNGPPQTPISVD